MNPKIRALIWEQFRVAGTLTLWTLLIIGIFLLTRNDYGLRQDFLKLAAFLIMAFPLLLLLRQNNAGHLDVRYEPRLSRLPLTAAPLAFIPAGMRLVCIIVFYLAMNAMYWLFFRVTISPHLLVYACALYAVMQALLWTRMYLLLLVFPVAAGIYSLLRLFQLVPKVSRTLGSIEIMHVTLFCLALLPPALLLIWLGVCWERRNEQRRLFSLDGVSALGQDFRRARSRGFDSVAEARVWFERAKSGINVTALIAVTVALFYPATMFLSIAGGIDFLGNVFFLPFASVRTALPYVAVVLIALFVGAIRDFSGRMWPLSITEFHRTKPVSDAHLAWCHILVMSRYAFVALVVMFGLVTFFYAYYFPTQLRILATAFDETDTALLPVVWLIQPLFFGCILTWLALWCARPLVAGAVIALVGVFADPFLGGLGIRSLSVTDFSVFADKFPGGFGIFFLYAFPVYLLLRSVRLLQYAWTRQLLSRRAWFIYLALHFVLAMLIWFPGPSGMGGKLGSFLITCAFTALVLSPVIALPRQIARKRAVA